MFHLVHRCVRPRLVLPCQRILSPPDTLLGRVGYQLLARIFLTALSASLEVGVPEAAQ
jgi:hypothetical protein